MHVPLQILVHYLPLTLTHVKDTHAALHIPEVQFMHTFSLVQACCVLSKPRLDVLFNVHVHVCPIRDRPIRGGPEKIENISEPQFHIGCKQPLG